VWDTVGSLGIPIPFIPNVSHKDFAFLETDLRINDTHAYHALAIDEHREAFAPTIWVKSTPKQGECPPPRDLDHVEQRWFVGAHANVGGGYEDDLLAQVPLCWIMSKATAHGLQFRHPAVIDGNANTSAINDSYAEMEHGAYKILTLGKRYYRPIGAKPVDTGEAIKTTINETIDASVFERWRYDASYRPKNLAEWAELRGADPSTLKQSVRADNATAIEQ
jgi:hypothetical protein